MAISGAASGRCRLAVFGFAALLAVSVSQPISTNLLYRHTAVAASLNAVAGTLEAGNHYVSQRLPIIHGPSFDQPAPPAEDPQTPDFEQRMAEAPASDNVAVQAFAQPADAPLTAARVVPGVRVTFYACIGDGFCGTMYSGLPVQEGAAACSWDLPIGTRFRIVGDPSGTVFVCLDRGHLEPTWVDIWRYDVADGWEWQQTVGSEADIEILE